MVTSQLPQHFLFVCQPDDHGQRGLARGLGQEVSEPEAEPKVFVAWYPWQREGFQPNVEWFVEVRKSTWNSFRYSLLRTWDLEHHSRFGRQKRQEAQEATKS